MALRYYANAPATQLSSAISDTATALTVDSVTGFPVSFPYTIIIDRGQVSEEVAEVTAVSGTTLTVTRGVDGTTAFGHSISATVEHGISARDIREANEHINDTTGVHGIGGTSSVVGTDDAQALKNKDLSDASNTFPSALATTSYVSSSVSDSRPIGEVTLFAGTSAPSGWLLCQGQAVSRTTYSALYGILGTAFGAGDGSTTFNLPDLRDRAPVGASGTKALGATGGAASTTLTVANLPAHTHSINHDHASFNSAAEAGHTHAINHDHPAITTTTDGSHDHTLSVTGSTGANNYPAQGQGSGSVTSTSAAPIGANGAHAHTVNIPSFTGTSGAGSSHVHAIDVPAYTGTSGSTGSGSSLSIQNPFQALNYIIKAA